jgi:hypothetical protein
MKTTFSARSCATVVVCCTLIPVACVADAWNPSRNSWSLNQMHDFVALRTCDSAYIFPQPPGIIALLR